MLKISTVDIYFCTVEYSYLYFSVKDWCWIKKDSRRIVWKAHWVPKTRNGECD